MYEYVDASSPLSTRCGLLFENTSHLRWSPGLRFAARIPYATAPEQSVLVENGESYIFINGTCHYWVVDQSGPLEFWNPTREGVLAEKDERALADDTCYGMWDQLAGAWGKSTSPDSGVGVFHDLQDSISCVFPCDMGALPGTETQFAIVQQMFRARQDWVNKLYAAGVSSAGPMRIAIFQGPDLHPALQNVGWPLSVPIDTLVLEHALAGPGRSYLVTDARDAQALRSLRQQFISGKLGSTDYFFIAIRNETIPEWSYALYTRDAIPDLENPDGLIPYPNSQVDSGIRGGGPLDATTNDALGGSARGCSSIADFCARGERGWRRRGALCRRLGLGSRPGLVVHFSGAIHLCSSKLPRLQCCRRLEFRPGESGELLLRQHELETSRCEIHNVTVCRHGDAAERRLRCRNTADNVCLRQ